MEKEYQIVTKNIPDKNLQKLKHIRQKNQYGCYEENLSSSVIIRVSPTRKTSSTRTV